MSLYIDGPYCPCCNTIISERKVHECLIFTNGLPDVGINHLKYIEEIEEIYAKVKTGPNWFSIPKQHRDRLYINGETPFKINEKDINNWTCTT